MSSAGSSDWWTSNADAVSNEAEAEPWAADHDLLAVMAAMSGPMGKGPGFDDVVHSNGCDHLTVSTDYSSDSGSDGRPAFSLAKTPPTDDDSASDDSTAFFFDDDVRSSPGSTATSEDSLEWMEAPPEPAAPAAGGAIIGADGGDDAWLRSLSESATLSGLPAAEESAEDPTPAAYFALFGRFVPLSHQTQVLLG